MAVHRMLGIDLGATSGRGIVCEFDGKTIRFIKEHRFGNLPVDLNGTLYWDFLSLYKDVKESIAMTRDLDVKTIGIDTWGLDFGLIDSRGFLVEGPVCYRDKRTEGVPQRVFSQVDKRSLFEQTGIQFLEGNTVFQLMAINYGRPELFERADRMLMIPDLLRYYLCGEVATEYSIGSTTQLFRPGEPSWNRNLLSKLKLPDKLFSKIVMPGTCASGLRKNVLKECGIREMSSVCVAAHDTASAVIAVPTREESFAYISSGTWSIFGTERTTAVLNETSFEDNWSNEGGHGGSIRYCRSLMGMWIFEECRRQDAQIRAMSYDALCGQAEASAAFRSIIDPEAQAFAGKCDMVMEIRKFCRRTGQPMPQTPGQILRCIFESMALNYKNAYQALCRNTGDAYPVLHILGGGSQNRMLDQMTADALGIEIIAGPSEATVCGNIFEQLLYCGYVSSLKEYRSLLADQLGDGAHFYPEQCDASWDEAYVRFLTLRGAHQWNKN